MTINRTMTQLLNTAFRAGVEQLAGPLPAIVEAYTAEPRPVADVLPAINLLVGGQHVKAKPLLDVPVAWPGDGASFAVTWPLAPGSVVGLVPQGADVSQWYANGTVGLPAPSARRFDLADVVALPAPPWRATPAQATDPAAMVLFANLLKLGDASASKAVALHGDVSPPSVSLANWALAVEFALNAAGSAIPPAQLFAVTVTDVGAIVATATKVRAK